jgi:hypothetical protein
MLSKIVFLSSMHEEALNNPNVGGSYDRKKTASRNITFLN